MDRFEGFTEVGEEVPGEEDINQFREDFEDSIILSDQFVSILCMTGVKTGGQIEGYFTDHTELEKFSEKMNRYGVKCFVDHGLDKEESTLWTMSKLFDDADSAIDEMLDDADRVVTVYLTSESSWDVEDVRGFVKLKECGSMSSYHRRFGDFLGYPEEDVESFVFEQLPGWKQLLLSLAGRDVPESIMVDEAARKYGESLGKKDKRILNAFNFHKVRDTEESFERALDTAFRRFEELDRFVDGYSLVEEVYY